MPKTIEDNFRDWESNTFGFGYGTGEQYTIPPLRRFLELCNEGPYQHSYDYKKLEDALGPTSAWLIINILCNHKTNIIEYGTSPRWGWLTSKGARLKEFMLKHTDEELVRMATDLIENSIPCYPEICNCGPKGFQKDAHCKNPFWDNDEISLPEALHPDFGDPQQLFNMRQWLIDAMTAKGAKDKGAGMGMGEADVDIELEGHLYNVRIKPILR